MGTLIQENAAGRFTVTENGSQLPGVYVSREAAQLTDALSAGQLEAAYKGEPLTVSDLAPLLQGYGGTEMPTNDLR